MFQAEESVPQPRSMFLRVSRFRFEVSVTGRPAVSSAGT